MAVEIDENQHKGSYYKTDKENARYDDLFMELSSRYVFLRINPDTYKIKTSSGRSIEQKNPLFKERVKVAVASRS